MEMGATRCLGCGAVRDLAKPFCSACGTPAAGPASAANARYSPFDAFSGLAIARLGPPCTVCGSTTSVPSFDGWHYVVAVFAFPAGMLIFLAPKRVCSNGHTFGSAGIAKAVSIGLMAFYGAIVAFVILWFVLVALGIFRAAAAVRTSH